MKEFGSRLERVEVILEGVDEPPFVDPDMSWCEANLDKLKAHPDSFVAIDTNKGEVLVSAADQSEFIEKLAKLEARVRTSLLKIHTSIFLNASGV